MTNPEDSWPHLLKTTLNCTSKSELQSTAYTPAILIFQDYFEHSSQAEGANEGVF